MRRPPKLRRRIPWWVKLVISLSIPVILFFLTLLGYHVYLAHKIDTKFHELEVRGIPTTKETFWAKVSVVKDESNAAPLLLTAIGSLDVPEGECTIPYFSVLPVHAGLKPVSEAECHEFKRWVDKNEAVFRILDAAFVKPHCRFTRHGEELLHEDVGRCLRDVKRLAKLLALKSHWLACCGDKQGAKEAIGQMMRLRNCLSEDVSVSHFLIQLSIDGMMRSAAVQLIERCDLSSDELDELGALFQKKARSSGLKLQLASEVVRTRTFLDSSFDELYKSLEKLFGGNGKSFEELPATTRYALRLMWWFGVGKKDSLQYLENMESIIETVDLPPREALDEIESIERYLQFQTPAFYSKCKVFASVLPHVIKIKLETETGNQLLLVLIEVEKYKNKHEGRLPESLVEIAGKENSFPLADPFGSGQISFQKRENGYILYSYGMDRSDNGGRKKSADDKDAEYDLVIEMFR